MIADIDKELLNINRKFNRSRQSGNSLLMRKYLGQLEALIARTTAALEANKTDLSGLQDELGAAFPARFRKSYEYEEYIMRFFRKPAKRG